MPTVQMAYDADGWGVGELVLADGRVVWHELPTVSDTDAGAGKHPVVELLQAYFAGEDVALDEVPVDLEYDSPFFSCCRRHFAPCRAARSSRTASSLRWRARRAPRALPGSFCARNRLGLFVPCHRVVAAGDLGTYGSLGLAYKRRLLELEGAL